MTGILYFSSTGNSLYIAKLLQRTVDGGIFFIPDYHGDGGEFDRIILVSPVYSYGLPAHVYELLSRLRKDRRLDIVLNYGGMLGGAHRLTHKLCRHYELNLHGIYTVKMPENFTVTFTVPAFYLKAELRAAPKRVQRLLEEMKKEAPHLPKEGKTKEALYDKNRGNWHLLSRDFSVTDACIGCGKCVTLCPSENIRLEAGKITFADRCVACLGCYHRCPSKAIRYKNKKKVDRYVNPFVDEREIGQHIEVPE